ncbi:MAG: hypothetical protein KGZ96_12510 [Clostridia bacterium]|jgi:spore germination protein YaaH|nr:hypothetical protein [Clostridia bacterium]
MSIFYKMAYSWSGKDNNEVFQFAGQLSCVAVVGFNFDENGLISVPNGFSGLLPLKQQGLEILPVVQNQVQGAFSGGLLEGILANSGKRRQLVGNCQKLIEQYGLRGIHLNLENYRGDAALLTQLVEELYHLLRPKAEVSMALPAKTKITTWFNGYDYQALTKVTDWTLLMSYDLHWSGGPPGPVGSLKWMGEVADYAIDLGWRREQLVLGIPLYGYDWPENGRGKVVLNHQVRALQGAKGITGRWHSQYGESNMTYKEGDIVHQVWYQDDGAVAAKVDLAKQKGLRGVGFWRLGFQFPGVWQALSKV